METININSNAFCLKAEKDIREISSVLTKNSPIKYVDFARVFVDGTMILLTTNGEMLKFYCDKGYSSIPVMPMNFSSDRTFYLLSSNCAMDQALMDLRERFQTDYMLNFIQRLDGNHEYYDAFGFGAAPEDTTVINFYLNNVEKLDKFTKLFCDKADSLIKQHERSKISIPEALQEQYTKILKIGNFCKRNYLYVNGQKILFTEREMQCLELIAKGRTAKETAKKLILSPRTVESYWSNIKSKLGCNTKMEILDIIQEIL